LENQSHKIKRLSRTSRKRFYLITNYQLQSGTETHSGFKWTPDKKNKARYLSENPGYDYEKIAEEVMGVQVLM
jgi:hypothetical protein